MSTQPMGFSDRPLSPLPEPVTGTMVPTARTQRNPRWWLPVTFALVGTAAFALVFWIPMGDMDDTIRTMILYAILVLTLLLVLGWLLRTPATRWTTALVLVLFLGGTAAVLDWDETVFMGDMQIIFRWRWQPQQDDVLTQHRQQQPKQQLPPPTLSAAVTTDCPSYRGQNRDGLISGPELTQIKSARWRQPCGRGYSSFAIVGNQAVTLEQRRNQETVVCYDTETGQERWTYSYTALFAEALGGKGPRSTPTIADTEVYTLGATGLLHCLDLKTGKVQWQVDVLQGNDNVMWGLSGSPLVYKQLVIVNPGVQKEGAPHGTLVAYDRVSGKYLWSAGKAQAGYSSPMLANLGGRDQIVLLDGEGISGYDPANAGHELWRYPWITQQNINVAQPLLLGEDRVLISAGYGVGCAVLHIAHQDGSWTAKPVWKKEVQQTLRCKFTSPVLWDGHVYGLDEGVLVCIDPNTGQRLWRDGRYKHGQILVSNGTLVVLGERGELALVEASPKGYRELTHIQALEGERTWNVPAVVNGRAYVRNDREMACYDLTGR